MKNNWKETTLGEISKNVLKQAEMLAEDWSEI